MLLTIALLASAAPAAETPAAKCRNPEKLLVDARDARPKLLNELPPAEHFYTVYRREDGCMVPVKVRERR